MADAFDVQRELAGLKLLLDANAQAFEDTLADLEDQHQDARDTVECGRAICVPVEEALAQVEEALVRLSEIERDSERTIIGDEEPTTGQVKGELAGVLALLVEVEGVAEEAQEVRDSLKSLIEGGEECREVVRQAIALAEPRITEADELFTTGNATTVLEPKATAYSEAESEYQEALRAYEATDVKDCNSALARSVQEKLDAVQAAIAGLEIVGKGPKERAGAMEGEAQRRWHRLPAYSTYWPFSSSELRAIEGLYDEALSIYQHELGDLEAAQRVSRQREVVRTRALRQRRLILGYAGGLAAIVATGIGLAAWRLWRLRTLGRDRRIEEDLF